MNEKRQYTRIMYPTMVHIFQENYQYSGQLLDISLQGALIQFDKKQCNIHLECPVTVSFELLQSNVSISFTGKVVTREQGNIHCAIQSIDLESLGHIKRIIELNIGQFNKLKEEIQHLCQRSAFA